MASERIDDLLAEQGEVRGMFQVDGMEPMPGYSNGYKWNGWECPKFKYTQAKEILDLRENWGEIQYSEDEHRVFQIRFLEYDDDDAEECGPDENGLYLAGENWTWEKVS